MRVQMVCQFGDPVRGLSPYADALLQSLGDVAGVSVEPVDYKSPYPAFLHPAEAGSASSPRGLSWCSPASWWRVASRPADILHIQHWAPPLASYLWLLAHMARQNGKRVVVTVHNPAPHERAGVFSSFERRLLRSADILLAHGSTGCDVLRERLGDGAPAIRCIAHGLHVAAAPILPTPDDYRQLKLDSAHKYVLLFGNLRGYKGVDALLDAWRLVQPQRRGVRLVIAGRLWDGRSKWAARLAARVLGTASDARQLRDRLSSAAEAGDVIVREGFQTDADIDALIRVSEFAIFPYLHFAGQSGAACRAAAMGCPVMVSRVGALPDLAMDESWVLEPGDREGLAVHMRAKLGSSGVLDAARVRQLDAVRRHDWKNIARDHAEIYRGLA